MDLFHLSDDFEPLKILHTLKASVNLQTIAVVDNVTCAPAIGTLRLAPNVSVVEAGEIQ